MLNAANTEMNLFIYNWQETIRRWRITQTIFYVFVFLKYKFYPVYNIM